MTLLQAVLLGIVEGITEFLPISSTGHLILAAKLLAVPQSEFLKTFQIFIQLGAMLAVVVLYAKRLFLNRAQLLRLAVAFIPTGIIGLTVYKAIKQYLLGSSLVVVWSLLIGGITILVFEIFFVRGKKAENTLDSLSYRDAFLIGLLQTLAFVPGVSRAAATILGGVMLGYKREAAVEFSFLLAIPTLLAASTLDLLKTAGTITLDQVGMLSVGFVVAFFVALGTVIWLLKFIKNHTFIGFGVYRIVVALAFLFFIGL